MSDPLSPSICCLAPVRLDGRGNPFCEKCGRVIPYLKETTMENVTIEDVPADAIPSTAIRETATLRDQFAMAALVTIDREGYKKYGNAGHGHMASDAYILADAMLKRRKK